MVLDSLNHLFVADISNNTVSEYDATSGATINATFVVGSQGLSGPFGLAVDGSNHLFVTNTGNNTVGEYDATTGATINAAFVTGLQLPQDLLFVAAVPEPSSLLLLAAAAGIGGATRWRKRLAARIADSRLGRQSARKGLD